jgi:hypothetical protein
MAFGLKEAQILQSLLASLGEHRQKLRQLWGRIGAHGVSLRS